MRQHQPDRCRPRTWQYGGLAGKSLRYELEGLCGEEWECDTGGYLGEEEEDQSADTASHTKGGVDIAGFEALACWDAESDG